MKIESQKKIRKNKKKPSKKKQLFLNNQARNEYCKFSDLLILREKKVRRIFWNTKKNFKF